VFRALCYFAVPPVARGLLLRESVSDPCLSLHVPVSCVVCMSVCGVTQLVGKDGVTVLESAVPPGGEKKVTSPPPTMEVEATATPASTDAMESA